MRKLLIGLLAFTLMLGIACKKEKIEPNVKIEKKLADDGTTGDIIGTNPFGLPDCHKGVSTYSQHAAIQGCCLGNPQPVTIGGLVQPCMPR